MGQKINPTIFRLGVNKTWKTEFFEKKNNELPLYVFKDLEIRTYIERVLETYGIILHDYKQHYNGSTLNLYVSYFITSDFMIDKKEASKELIIINANGDKKTIKKSLDSGRSLNYPYLRKEVVTLSGSSAKPYKLKYYLNSIPTTYTNQQEFTLFNNKDIKNFDNVNSKVNGVFGQVFKVLDLFNNNSVNIVLNFCCANKDLYSFKLTQEKVFMSLQKFRNTPFLKEGIELLFHVVYNSNSASLLTKFLAFQLKKIKRHKFFLSF